MKNKLIICLIFFIYTVFPQQEPEPPVLTNEEKILQQRAGQVIISFLKNTILDFEQTRLNILQQTSGVTDLQQQISEVQNKIAAAKIKFKITPIETQIAMLKNTIDQAAVLVYAKSVDPKTHVNMYRIINAILVEQIYQEPIMQDNLIKILEYQRTIIESLRSQTKMVQNLGVTLDKLTAQQEQKNLEQLLSQIYPLKGQLMSLQLPKPTSDLLFPLKRELIKYQTMLENIYTSPQLKIDQSQRIQKYRFNIKQLTLMRELLRNPRMITQITPDQIALFEPVSSIDL